MRLTKHFALEEFTASETATSMGIGNEPTKEHLSNLKVTAMGLEQVRKFFGGNPITITSGYRSAALNEVVGGVKDSDHSLGYAADFYIEDTEVLEVATMIATSDIAFDQLIYEPDRGIVHISFNPKLRNQTLTQLGGPGSAFVMGVQDV